MRLGSVEIHAAFLLAAIALAWVSWTGDEAVHAADDETAIWNMDDGAVNQVTYRTGKREITLQLKKDDNGNSYVWATTKREKPIPKPKKTEAKPHKEAAETKDADAKPKLEKEATETKDADAKPKLEKEATETKDAEAKPKLEKEATETKDADAKPKLEKEATGTKDAEAKPKPDDKPKTQTVIKTFRGSQKARDLMAKMKVLMAKRALGQPEAEELNELKLTDPEATLIVSTGTTQRTLEIGMAAYGGGLRYVRNPATGIVYALDAKPLDNLRWADSRLVERELLPFKQEQTTSLRLRAGNRTQRWDTLDETAQTWLSKLFRLKIMRYVQDDENIHEVSGKTLESTSVFTAELSAANGVQVTLKLIRVGAEKKARYFVQSNHTNAVVSVSRHLADELERDLDGLVR